MLKLAVLTILVHTNTHFIKMLTIILQPIHSSTLSVIATSTTSGQYNCLARQEGVTAVVSHTATLQVVTKPQIRGNKVADMVDMDMTLVDVLQVQYGVLGGQARLECRVVSVGEVTVSWERKGEPLRHDDDIRVTVKEFEKISELFVNVVKSSDFGEYGCLAENDVGRAYEVFTIKIKGKQSLVG